MTEPAFADCQPDDAEGLQAHVAAIRSRVRRDLHATSLPLLLLGTATVAGELPQVMSQRWSTDGLLVGGDWYAGVFLTAAFAALWWIYRRRAVRAGVGRPAGFAAAAVLGLILTLTLGLWLLALMGPFIIFGAGLLLVAAWQRNALLAWWAVLVGGLGVFEGFYGITNRLPASLLRDWEHPAIYLALGILTVLAGLAARIRENRGQ